MTVTGFLAWNLDDASGRGRRLIDGEALTMPPSGETRRFLPRDCGGPLDADARSHPLLSLPDGRTAAVVARR
jgi:hypothetical protein